VRPLTFAAIRGRTSNPSVGIDVGTELIKSANHLILLANYKPNGAQERASHSMNNLLILIFDFRAVNVFTNKYTNDLPRRPDSARHRSQIETPLARQASKFSRSAARDGRYSHQSVDADVAPLAPRARYNGR
jgi:hypothetical protein